MSEKEIKLLEAQMLREQKKIKGSKEYAIEYLKDIGVLTKSGNFKKAFKPA